MYIFMYYFLDSTTFNDRPKGSVIFYYVNFLRKIIIYQNESCAKEMWFKWNLDTSLEDRYNLGKRSNKIMEVEATRNIHRI